MKNGMLTLNTSGTTKLSLAVRTRKWCIAIATVSIGILFPSVASAGFTGLFNTGVDASGVPVADDTIGDIHYTLIGVPSGPVPDERIRRQIGGFPIGPWIPDGANLSAWIGPDYNHSLAGPNGIYTYETTFSLASTDDPLMCFIMGQWAGDDGASNSQILLNGNPVVFGTPTTPNFGAFTPFTINSGFQTGLNTLQFKIENIGGSATGLRVEMSGVCVPEPSSLLFGLALVGVCSNGRFRKRQKIG